MKKGKTGKKKVSALVAASLGRSATAQVRHHTHEDFDKTGTNVSYEGATAPGAGGSVGTGYASGKEAVDATIRTNSDYVQNRGGKPKRKPGSNNGEEPGSNDFNGEF